MYKQFTMIYLFLHHSFSFFSSKLCKQIVSIFIFQFLSTIIIRYRFFCSLSLSRSFLGCIYIFMTLQCNLGVLFEDIRSLFLSYCSLNDSLITLSLSLFSMIFEISTFSLSLSLFFFIIFQRYKPKKIIKTRRRSLIIVSKERKRERESFN